MTYTRPKTSRSLLTGAEVLVNLYYEWDPAHPTITASAAGAYDLESVLLHEFGHLLHLDDEPTASDVMKPRIKAGVIRNRIGSDDIGGIRHLYPMLVDFDVPDLKKEAEVVVRGRVTGWGYASFEADFGFPDTPGHQRRLPLIYTAHRVQISRVLNAPHGATLPPTIDVLTLGGETFETSLHVEGEANIAPQEDIILFLSRDHTHLPGGSLVVAQVSGCWSKGLAPGFNVPSFKETYSVFGGFQGKYTVHRSGDEEYVWNSVTAGEGNGLLLEAFIARLQ